MVRSSIIIQRFCGLLNSTRGGLNVRKRKAFPKTNTLDKAIAPAANTGESSKPQAG